jgi:protein gp37
MSTSKPTLLPPGNAPGFSKLKSQPRVFRCKLWPATNKKLPEHADYRGGTMKFERISVTEIVGKHGIAGVHPAADILPLATDEEFQEMCVDVKAQGFLNPVRINNDNLLIDGRNRLQVSWAVGLDSAIIRFNPPDVLAYVLSENLHCRQLTVGQRAMIAENIANMPAHRPAGSVTSVTVSRHQAAETVGTTPKAISQVRLIKEWAPVEAKKVQNGEISLEKGYEIARKTKKLAVAREIPEKSKSAEVPTIQLQGIIGKNLVQIPYPEPKGKHTFNRTNDSVDWASWTWNPVTGCLHGCPYCYAREMAYRESYKASYPIQFAPLFHHERLDDPVNTVPGTERPQDGRVFVCSMADLFGEWVPQEWIDKVFDACLAAPAWEYLFLTKFPQRYRRINLPPRAWFGASVDMQKRVKVTEKTMPQLDCAVRWLSLEPLLEPVVFSDLSWCDLMVIGAQSGTIQPDGPVPAFAPQIEWVMSLIGQARAAGVPVYLKPNLIGELTESKPGMQFPQEQPRRRP